jgi:hypothetical protein
MGLFDGLFRYKRAKIYNLTKTMNDRRANEGRDFSKDLLVNSLSRHIQRKDLMQNFIGFIQDIFVENIKTVTRLKLFKAFSMPKDYDKVK